MEHACVDGILVPAAEARVPATDDGLLRGDGAFEVIRLYGGRPFALDDHLARLGRSAEALRLDVDLDAFRGDVERVRAAAGGRDGVLRLVATRGGRRVVLTEPLRPRLAAVRLGAVAYQPSIVLDGVKSLSYAANMLAGRLARERGFDDALLVAPDGTVLELPTATIFWGAAGELFTPPLDGGLLQSITRARLLELTGARERRAGLPELQAADEVFVASTTREVVPVVAVEETTFAVAGPLTERAAMLLRERIESELETAAPA